MAMKLVKLDNGLLMEVEVQEDPNGIQQINGGDENEILGRVAGSMEMVESMLIKSVEPISNAYKALNQDVTLEKAEIEIGIGFSAEGNIFIAKGKGSANLKVKLVLSPK